MIPLDIVSSNFDMVSNGRRAAIFIESIEVFHFPDMKSFCYAHIKIIAVPATGFVNDSILLGTIQAVLVRKERFDRVSVLKNYLKIDKNLEVI